jgi:RNA polymerase primary sigma factor
MRSDPTSSTSRSTSIHEHAELGDAAQLPAYERDREGELARTLVETRRAFWSTLLVADRAAEVLAVIAEHANDESVVAIVDALRSDESVTESWARLAEALDRAGDEHTASEAVVALAARTCGDWHRRATHARARYHNARHRFVRSNLRLVIVFARRYETQRMPLVDRIQEGNIGLLKAVDRFDPERGVRFSTYAAWWIRHSITRALNNSSRTVRIPPQIQALASKAARARRDLRQELGRDPDLHEIAVAIDCDPQRLEWALRTMEVRSVSLDVPEHEDGVGSLVDALSDGRSLEDLEEMIDRHDRVRAIGFVGELPARERHIVSERFGLTDSSSYTLSQIGRRLGISRERARQLHSDALDQLRRTFVPDAPRVSKRRPSAFLR